MQKVWLLWTLPCFIVRLPRVIIRSPPEETIIVERWSWGFLPFRFVIPRGLRARPRRLLPTRCWRPQSMCGCCLAVILFLWVDSVFLWFLRLQIHSCLGPNTFETFIKKQSWFPVPRPWRLWHVKSGFLVFGVFAGWQYFWGPFTDVSGSAGGIVVPGGQTALSEGRNSCSSCVFCLLPALEFPACPSAADPAASVRGWTLPAAPRADTRASCLALACGSAVRAGGLA